MKTSSLLKKALLKLNNGKNWYQGAFTYAARKEGN